MTHTFVSALILLILIVDPFGNIPIFSSTLKSFEAKKRRKIIAREHLIAFVILVFFMLIGERFLQAMGLSQSSLQIAGGVVLFLISLKMIFPGNGAMIEETTVTEPLIVPLAIPMVAGPSALATVMLLVSQEPTRFVEWLLALAIAIAVSCIVHLGADKFKEKLGTPFLVAMEKLMGLILVALSVEMMIRGVRMFLTGNI